MRNILLLDRRTLDALPGATEYDRLQSVGFHATALMKFVGVIEEDDTITVAKCNHELPRSISWDQLEALSKGILS